MDGDLRLFVYGAVAMLRQTLDPSLAPEKRAQLVGEVIGRLQMLADMSPRKGA
jgi:hypothetical protein